MNITEIEKTRKIYQIGIPSIPVVEIPEEASGVSSFFKKLSNSFSIFSSSEEKSQIEENKKNADSKTELENIFTSAFESMNYEKIKKMLDSGYVLNDSQKEMLTTKINALIEKPDNPNIISLYKIGLNPTDENMHRMFFNSTNCIMFSDILAMHEAEKILDNDVFEKIYPNNKVNSLKSYAHIIDKEEKNNGIYKMLKDYISNKSNKESLFENWKYLLNNYPFKHPAYVSLEYCIIKASSIFIYDFIPSLPPKEQEGIIQKIDSLLKDNTSESWNKIKPILLDNVNKSGNNLSDLENKTREIFKKSVNQVAPVIQELRTQTLPEEATIIIEDIKEVYTSIVSDSKVDEIYTREVRNLIENRLTTAITQYNDIDAKYRETLVNVKKMTSKELLIDSITNIQTRIHEIHEEVNKNKLSDLSATNRYTKTIGKLKA